MKNEEHKNIHPIHEPIEPRTKSEVHTVENECWPNASSKSELHELKSIFDHIPVGIVYLDSEFRFISSNKFFAKLSGYDHNFLKGKLCYEVVGEYSNDSTKKGLEKICSFCKKDDCFSSGKPTVIERPLGDSIIKVTTIPELDEKGDIYRFLELIEDITEQKRVEAEAVRASQLAALGELAASVAHEINNPINGIINYAQILLNKYSDGDNNQDIANRIIKEGDRIAYIVKSLLSFATDRKEVKRLVSIQEILSNSLVLTEMQMRKDGIKLIMNIPDDLPKISVQAQQIEQVFLNIISNARYALNQRYPQTDKNKIFEITAENIIIDTKNYNQITFRDWGTGIPSSICDKVLTPFFSTKPSNIGTGLGLSISHGIIRNHSGNLLVESIDGEFTKIIIQLPLE